MPDGNGRESSRLDRVEALLDKLATSHYLHDERLARAEALHEENEQRWKQWQEEERVWREGQRQRDRIIDERIEKLVLAIRDLIRGIPPENLRSI